MINGHDTPAIDLLVIASNGCQKISGNHAIHFSGLAGLNKPIVWAFPKLAVCLNCGFTEFEVPEKERTVLAEGTPVEGTLVWPRTSETDATARKAGWALTLNMRLNVLHRFLRIPDFPFFLENWVENIRKGYRDHVGWQSHSRAFPVRLLPRD